MQVPDTMNFMVASGRPRGGMFSIVMVVLLALLMLSALTPVSAGGRKGGDGEKGGRGRPRGVRNNVPARDIAAAMQVLWNASTRSADGSWNRVEGGTSYARRRASSEGQPGPLVSSAKVKDATGTSSALVLRVGDIVHAMYGTTGAFSMVVAAWGGDNPSQYTYDIVHLDGSAANAAGKGGERVAYGRVRGSLRLLSTDDWETYLNRRQVEQWRPVVEFLDEHRVRLRHQRRASSGAAGGAASGAAGRQSQASAVVESSSSDDDAAAAGASNDVVNNDGRGVNVANVAAEEQRHAELVAQIADLTAQIADLTAQRLANSTRASTAEQLAADLEQQIAQHVATEQRMAQLEQENAQRLANSTRLSTTNAKMFSDNANLTSQNRALQLQYNFELLQRQDEHVRDKAKMERLTNEKGQLQDQLEKRTQRKIIQELHALMSVNLVLLKQDVGEALREMRELTATQELCDMQTSAHNLGVGLQLVAAERRRADGAAGDGGAAGGAAGDGRAAGGGGAAEKRGRTSSDDASDEAASKKARTPHDDGAAGDGGADGDGRVLATVVEAVDPDMELLDLWGSGSDESDAMSVDADILVPYEGPDTGQGYVYAPDTGQGYAYAPDYTAEAAEAAAAAAAAAAASAQAVTNWPSGDQQYRSLHPTFGQGGLVVAVVHGEGVRDHPVGVWSGDHPVGISQFYAARVPYVAPYVAPDATGVMGQ